MSARARNESNVVSSGGSAVAKKATRVGEVQKPVEDVIRYAIKQAGVVSYMITTDGGKGIAALTMPVRYIRIYHARPEWLSLAEVQVVGSKWNGQWK